MQDIVEITTPTAPAMAISIFPYYAGQSDWLRAHPDQAACPWNPNLPPKHWEDPGALKSRTAMVFYTNVLQVDENGNYLQDDAYPVLGPLGLPKAQAASVNIPPEGTNVPGADQPEVQFPLRTLGPHEVLKFVTFPGGITESQPLVVNTLLFTDPYQGSKDQAAQVAETLRLVKLIAAKVGV